MPGTSDYVGYLQLCGVPLIVRGTSICVGYLYLCGVPLIVRGTSICAGYFESCRVPQIVRDTFNYAGYLYLCGVPWIIPSTLNYAGIIPFVDAWRITAFPTFLSNSYIWPLGATIKQQRWRFSKFVAVLFIIHCSSILLVYSNCSPVKVTLWWQVYLKASMCCLLQIVCVCVIFSAIIRGPRYLSVGLQTRASKKLHQQGI